MGDRDRARCCCSADSQIFVVRLDPRASARSNRIVRLGPDLPDVLPLMRVGPASVPARGASRAATVGERWRRARPRSRRLIGDIRELGLQPARPVALPRAFPDAAADAAGGRQREAVHRDVVVGEPRQPSRPRTQRVRPPSATRAGGSARRSAGNSTSAMTTMPGRNRTKAGRLRAVAAASNAEPGEPVQSAARGPRGPAPTSSA